MATKGFWHSHNGTLRFVLHCFYHPKLSFSAVFWYHFEWEDWLRKATILGQYRLWSQSRETKHWDSQYRLGLVKSIFIGLGLVSVSWNPFSLVSVSSRSRGIHIYWSQSRLGLEKVGLVDVCCPQSYWRIMVQHLRDTRYCPNTVNKSRHL